MSGIEFLGSTIVLILLHYLTIYSQTFVCMYQQVLSLVTPNPTEVIRTSAFRFPDVNRSTDFLPRETKLM